MMHAWSGSDDGRLLLSCRLRMKMGAEMVVSRRSAVPAARRLGCNGIVKCCRLKVEKRRDYVERESLHI